MRISLRTADKQLALRRWLMTSFRWLELVNLVREIIALGKIPYIQGMPESLSEALEDGLLIRTYKVKVNPSNPEKITVKLLRSEIPAVVEHLAALEETQRIDAEAPMSSALAPPKRIHAKSEPGSAPVPGRRGSVLRGSANRLKKKSHLDAEDSGGVPRDFGSDTRRPAQSALPND